MIDKALMAKAAAMAAAIVTGYRAQAPGGCDPRNDSASVPNYLDNIPNYGALISGQVSGLQQTTPQVIRANQQFDPALGGISSMNLNNMLFGQPATTVGNNPKNPLNTVPAQPGLLEMLNNAGASLASGTTANVNAIGPQLMAAYAATNPAAAGMVSNAGNLATSALSNGMNLPPGLFHTVDQAVMKSNIGTLGGTGDAGAYNDALGMSQFANQVYNQNFNNLLSAAGTNQNFYGSVIPTITGATGATGGSAAAGGQGLVSGSTGGTFAPQVNYQDMLNTLFNAQSSTNVDNAQMTNSLIGSIIGSSGSVGGSLGAAAMKGGGMSC